MKAGFTALALLLALAGCSSVSADFVKSGATKEQVRADNAACRAEADAQVGRDADISRDIRGTARRGPSDQRQLLNQTREIDTAARFERIFAACMSARGYTIS